MKSALYPVRHRLQLWLCYSMRVPFAGKQFLQTAIELCSPCHFSVCSLLEMNLWNLWVFFSYLWIALIRSVSTTGPQALKPESLYVVCYLMAHFVSWVYRSHRCDWKTNELSWWTKFSTGSKWRIWGLFSCYLCFYCTHSLSFNMSIFRACLLMLILHLGTLWRRIFTQLFW